mgnify:CR=1 FL=1
MVYLAEGLGLLNYFWNGIDLFIELVSWFFKNYGKLLVDLLSYTINTK